MASEHVVAACGEASSQGPETTTRISALLYLWFWFCDPLVFVVKGQEDFL